MTDNLTKYLTGRVKRFVAAVLLVAILALGVFAQVPHQALTGKVVGVSDGDTITVLDSGKRQHKIRLDGIDAPESNQAFGDKAKKSLSDLVIGKTVTVASSKTGRYGCIVGKVMLNGKDVNLEQIRRGYAWFYRKYADELSRIDAKMYELAETDARDKQRGLWASPGPIPPWELRAAQGQLPDCPDYSKVSERNRVPCATGADAVKAGYRKAKALFKNKLSALSHKVRFSFCFR